MHWFDPTVEYFDSTQNPKNKTPYTERPNDKLQASMIDGKSTTLNLIDRKGPLSKLAASFVPLALNIKQFRFSTSRIVSYLP